jgi:hypothetical protein
VNQKELSVIDFYESDSTASIQVWVDPFGNIALRVIRDDPNPVDVVSERRDRSRDDTGVLLELNRKTAAALAEILRQTLERTAQWPN